MSTVALLIDARTSEDSVRQVGERLRGAGHEVITVSGHAGRGVDVDAVHPEQFDGVLVPAGFRRNHFRTHERFLAFLRDLYALGKPLAAHHPECWALIPAGGGRASWPAVKRALIVEPGRRAFADSFGAQPMKVGAPNDIEGLVGAFLGELNRRPAAAASSE